MKKQIERTERTKSAILNAFWDIYAEKPISKITINELTKHAGIHRSTFYLYFNDIYEVLSSAEDMLLENCESLFSNIQTPQDAYNIANIFGRFYRDNLSKLSSVMGPSGDPAFSFALRDRILPPMMEAFCVPEDDREMRITFEYMITAAFSLLLYTKDNSSEAELQSHIKRIHNFLAYGINPMIKAHTKDPALLNKLEECQAQMRQNDFNYPTG